MRPLKRMRFASQIVGGGGTRKGAREGGKGKYAPVKGCGGGGGAAAQSHAHAHNHNHCRAATPTSIKCAPKMRLLVLQPDGRTGGPAEYSRPSSRLRPPPSPQSWCKRTLTTRAAAAATEEGASKG